MLVMLLWIALGPVAGRPDPAVTPGVDRYMTTAQVCATTWGRDARHVTLAMKKRVFAAYGIAWSQHAKYEVDHLIPRELAGADDVRNLWPQPWTGPWNAHQKDRLENALHREVCSAAISLAAAQTALRTDWIAAYRQRFGTP